VIAFFHDTVEFLQIIGPMFRWVHRLVHLIDGFYE
jgi:hypothetical protein